ncbi:hypothetical protein FA13DRAFT_1095140 [Coprinellus micaceus]|uniref:Uncharacterized protein n=1 Tax=Coprinellus micaceus TaxID=71717 RepID=A0A4Y7SWD9_COPMI|nr:hypothetical protein FA13DRAFT_1095140 [Coprinellus micaceus]
MLRNGVSHVFVHLYHGTNKRIHTHLARTSPQSPRLNEGLWRHLPIPTSLSPGVPSAQPRLISLPTPPLLAPLWCHCTVPSQSATSSSYLYPTPRRTYPTWREEAAGETGGRGGTGSGLLVSASGGGGWPGSIRVASRRRRTDEVASTRTDATRADLTRERRFEVLDRREGASVCGVEDDGDGGRGVEQARDGYR